MSTQCVLPAIEAAETMQRVSDVAALSGLMSAEMALRQDEPALANEVGREIIRLAEEIIEAFNAHVVQHGRPVQVVLPHGKCAVEVTAIALASGKING